MAITETALHFQGPIPPPQVLSGCERVLPGTVDRVIAMAERAAAHRMRVESRGQALGFVIAAITVVGSLVLIALNKSLPGVAAVTGAVVGLSGLIVWSKAKGLPPSQGRGRG